MSIVSKEELEKLNIVKGEVIGLSLKNDFEFVLEKKGKEGLKRVEKEMARLGYPLKYKELKKFQWYPEKMNLLLLVMQRVFNWDDETMREAGRFGAKISSISRIMIKYFVSMEKLIKVVGKYWRNYHTTGNLVPIEVNKKERYALIELRDFTAGYPVHCRYLEGYFWQKSKS